MTSTLWRILSQLQSAFSYNFTFMWFCSLVVGACAGSDQIGGVSGIVRNLGMSERAYHSLLRLFSSRAINHGLLAQLWMSLAISLFDSNLLYIAGRKLFIIDATKVAKTGRKMPGVLGMKDTVNDGWMRGHYFESIAIVARGVMSFFPIHVATTLLCEKTGHDGNLVERCLAFIQRYPQIQGAILIGDAWYSKSKLIVQLAKTHALVMVTRLAKNVVAYDIHIESPFSPLKRGRKKKYGKKIKLIELFSGELLRWTLQDNQGRQFEVQGWVKDLLWKPLGMMVRFIGISHPEKGLLILMCSDTNMAPQDIAQSYVYRFWIEVAFHNAKSMIGSFTYRFWLKAMDRLPKFPKAMNLSDLPNELIKKMNKKIAAFELFVMAGMIAQGLLVYMAIYHGAQVTAGARFWLRTKRGDESSERIAAAYVKIMLRNLSEDTPPSDPLTKFLLKAKKNAVKKFGCYLLKVG